MMAISRPDLHDVIALLYETAVDSDADRWQNFSAVLAEFHLACVSGLMLFPEPLNLGPVAMAVTGVPEAASADYVAEYHRHDLLSHAAVAAGGRLVRSNEVIDMADFDRHVFWNEFSRQNTGAWHGIAQGGLGPGRGLMIVCRERGEAAFSEADERDFRILRGHVNNAIRLGERLGVQRLQATAFHTMRHPALVIDGAGRFHFANAAAENLLHRHGVTMAKGGRALPALAASGQLAALVQAVQRGEADVFARLPGCIVGEMLFARFGPIPPGFASFGIAPVVDGILVSLSEPQQEAGGPGTAAQVFGLTAAEGQVAHLLVQGLTAPQIAARRSVSEATVRSQLEQLIAKTGSASLREAALRLDRAGRI